MSEKERCATTGTWAEIFKSEGYSIHESTIKKYLREAEIIGETARSNTGRVIKNGFFSESQVRRACAELLETTQMLPDEDGYIIDEGKRYATIPALSASLGIPESTIRYKMRGANLVPMEGRVPSGLVRQYYPEAELKILLEELLKPLPKADKDGFFLMWGVRFATMKKWSEEYEFGEAALLGMIKSRVIVTITGRAHNGPIRDFYAEPDIKEMIKEFSEQCMEPDADGFIYQDGERYAALSTWATLHNIDHSPLHKRMQKSPPPSILGRGKNNRPTPYYKEADIIKFIEDELKLQSYPKEGKDGFIWQSGVRYATRRHWSKQFGITPTTMNRRFEDKDFDFIEGRNQSGNVRRYYAEADVHSVCADLIEKKACAASLEA